MKGTSRFAMRNRAVTLVATAAALAGPGAKAWADDLKAAYAITLAGFSVGEASLSMSSSARNYHASLAMRLSGIAGQLTGARGAAVAAGSIVGTRPAPASYAITTTNGHALRTVRMALQGGTVSLVEVKPPVDAFPDRIAVSAADKVNVMDPISALVMPAPRSDKMLDPSGCDRKLAVFDGVARFDVSLSYARTGNVTLDGYTGPALTCSARYTPIAGHRTSLKSTSFMAENRDMEVSLAPVGGAMLLVPVKIAVRTLFGMLEIDATHIRPGGGNMVPKPEKPAKTAKSDPTHAGLTK
ncbi:Protein of unknown function [Rhizobiales bacterium GAS188]|nr:Protein of unknown function [Rhizobiales bacterium GAS188]